MWTGVPVNVFALVFIAVALGLPYWAEYEYKSIGLKINYGLFQVCSDTIGCELTDPTFSIVAVCVLESIATLLLLLSLIAASVKLCYSTNQPAFFKVAGVLSLIAALLIIIGVIIFGTAKELQTGKARNTDYMLHAGFFIAILAALLSIIAGTLFLVDPLLERRHRGEETFKARAPVVEYQSRILANDQMYNANGHIITHPYNSQPGAVMICQVNISSTILVIMITRVIIARQVVVIMLHEIRTLMGNTREDNNIFMLIPIVAP